MTGFIEKKKENYKIIEEQKREKKIELSGFPYWLTIDPTNYCNLRCPLCPTGQKRGIREAKNLSLQQFKRVMDTLGPYLIHVDLCNWGEPLLNEDIYEMIKYAKKYSVNVKFDTNINVLNESAAEKLIGSGLDKIILSIDGASQETYGKYRRGGNFQTVLKNVKLLLNKREKALKQNPLIEWQFLVFRHNEHEMDDAKNMAKELGVDEINFTPPYAGSLQWLTTLDSYRSKFYEVNGDEVSFKTQPRQEICNWLWDAVTINSDGSVAPCCSVEDAEDDFFRNFEPDNFNFNNEKYKQARKRIISKEEPNTENGNVCMRCDHWGWSNHMDVGFILAKLKRENNES